MIDNRLEWMVLGTAFALFMTALIEVANAGCGGCQRNQALNLKQQSCEVLYQAMVVDVQKNEKNVIKYAKQYLRTCRMPAERGLLDESVTLTSNVGWE